MAMKSLLFILASLPLFTCISANEHQAAYAISPAPVKTPSPPLVTKPPTTFPPVLKPPVAAPPVSKPPTVTPPVSKPPTTAPPVSKPPTTKPPVSKPPTATPPVTKPPTTTPPITKPPSTTPPASKPPTIAPPVSKPPTAAPPTPPKNTKECYPLCVVRCKLHSRQNVCLRACVTCCDRCKCVPPGYYGNKEVCGKCYTDMTTHGGRPKCP